MHRSSIYIFALLSVFLMVEGTMRAQDQLRTIRTNASRVTFKDGDRPVKGWRLNAELNPDILEVFLINGKPHEVTFKTDIESISFNVEEGKKYDFVIQMGDQRYPTQIVGKRFVPTLFQYNSGSRNDAIQELHGPILDLEGGGWPGDAAMQTMIDVVRGCTDCKASIDVVLLGAADYSYKGRDFDGDFNRRVYQMNGVDSADTFIITSPELSRTEEVVQAVSRAEVVFFLGGDQCEYFKSIQGSPIQKVVQELYKRGGGIGGNSAGLAIQGAIAYDGCGGSVTAEEALSDPYGTKLTFSYNFLSWPFLENTVTDTHLVKRDRIGRTFAFLARQLKDGKAKVVHSIAVDEGAAVVVDKYGLAKVYGSTNAYFITADHKPEVCEKGKPLTYSNFKIWKRKAGETFDIKNRPSDGFYLVSVKEGKLDRDPY